ncbi:MAG: hypothetical protein AAGG48_30275 [Planctomycetota bacterium]
MPAVVGCDQKTTVTPVTIVTSPIEDLDDALFVFILIWPYLFGAAIAAMFIAIAIARPQNLGKWLLPVPIAFQIVLTVIGSFAVYNALEREAVAFSVFVFLLPSLGLMCFCAIAWRRRGSFDAAIRAISGLAVLASVGIYLNTILMFATKLLYGFYVALIAAGGMLFSSWLLHTRGERCLSDSNAELRPAQFGIRALFVWTLIVAVLITGFQVFLMEKASTTTVTSP